MGLSESFVFVSQQVLKPPSWMNAPRDRSSAQIWRSDTIAFSLVDAETCPASLQKDGGVIKFVSRIRRVERYFVVLT